MYGRVEVRAKLPRGDWLWPAIWLLPQWNQYGDWPASGEIDIMESRGNAASTYPNPPGGSNSFGSTLHVGPGYPYDLWAENHAEYTLSSGDFADDFHIFGLIWSENGLQTYLDTQDNVVLSVAFNESYWQKAG
jgi:beta-glucanase (GH16 family)